MVSAFAANAATSPGNGPAAGTATAAALARQPASVQALHGLAERLLGALPSTRPAIPAEPGGVKAPLSRFWHRELDLADRLLATVRQDLGDLQRMCRGETKHTNHLRMLAAWLTKAQVPEHWLKYTVPKRYTINEWIFDFGRRLDQLTQIPTRLESRSPSTSSVWLGGLFFPTRFITATRQAAAQQQGRSLEGLHLVLDLDGDAARSEDSFSLEGLHMECARWHAGWIDLDTDELSTPLQSVVLRWTETPPDQANRALIPVYLNSDRLDLLCSAWLPCDPHKHVLAIQRAVALVAGT